MKKLLLLLVSALVACAQPTTPINNLKLQTAGVNQTGLVQANGASAAAAATAANISTALDLLGSTQGSVLYRNATEWVLLPPGTSGYFLQTNGAAANPSWGVAGGSSAANPTASVGLSVVNGVATTFMRSDAAPPLDQTISPTMTGQWRFQNGVLTSPTLVGATSNSTSLTNNTLKVGPLAVPHFTNSEEPVLMVAGESGSSDNTLYVGGASPSLNAATRIDFYVAATNTTTTGTRRARLTSTVFTMSVPIQLPSSTVGALPTASTVEGALAYVTDATATTRLSVAAGGGANKVVVFSDGTNWLIL